MKELSSTARRNVTLLGKAAVTKTIFYDKSYTRLQWNVAAAPRALPGVASRRREFCHSAASPSTFTRCFNRDGEGVSAK